MKIFKKPVRVSNLTRRSLKGIIHLLALGYLVGLFYAGVTDNLGPDPVDTLLKETGIWAVSYTHLTMPTILLV